MPKKVIKTVNEDFAAEGAFPQHIDEFCLGLSRGDSRVELISAFNMKMKREKKFKNYAGFYRAEFEQFISQPA